MVNDYLQQCVEKLSTVCGDIPFAVNTSHIYHRMQERDIPLNKILETFNKLFKYDNAVKFCLGLYQFEDTKPFRIEVKDETNTIILCFGRTNNKWKFTTVLDTLVHSKGKKSNNFYYYVHI